MNLTRTTALLTLLLASALPATAADRLEQWFNLMPKDTVGVIAVKNTPELLADWDQSHLAKFMQDAEVQRWTAPLRKDGDAPWDKFFKDHYGTGMHDTLKDYPGALVSFLVLNELDDFKDTPPNVSLCEVAGKQKEIEAHKVAEVEAEKKKNSALKLSTADIGGVSVQIASDGDADDNACFTSWAVIGDVMIESTSRKHMEYMIAALKNNAGDPPGPAREHLTRIGQVTNGGGDAMLYFNGERLLHLGEKALAAAEAKKKDAKQSGMPGFDIKPKQIMEMLGVQELQAAALTLELQDGQMRSDLTILHPEKPSGLISLMRATASDVALPAFIPAGVLQGSVGRYDFAKLYDGILGMITKLGPMAMMVTMQIPQFEQQLGFKIRDDLFGSLTDEMFSVQDGALDKQSQVLGFKIKNADKLGGALDSLKRFVGAGFGAFEESDYLGFTVNTLKTSQTASAATEMAYCNTGKHLLVSIGNQEVLKKVLARIKDPAGPSLWEGAQVQKLLAAVPKNFGGASVTDVGSMLDLLVTAASALESQAGVPKGSDKKKGPGKKGSEMAAAASTLNLAARPSKKTFQRYFGSMLGTQYSHPDAIQIHYLVMPPEAP